MISYEPEIHAAVGNGQLTEAGSQRILPLERRELFSIHGELRVMTWLAVLLLSAGAGLLIRNNLDRIGPAVLIVLLGLAAAGCYGFALAKKLAPARWQPSLFDEYILLLGALLLSTDVGYAESQYHLLDSRWVEHFLFLAVIHGVAAYFFNSRSLLSLSLASLASWLGLRGGSHESEELGLRSLVCSSLTLLWRLGNLSVPSRAWFDPVFDQFIALTGFLGALTWLFHEPTELAGTILITLFSAGALVYASRTRKESFAIYSVIALLIMVDYEILTHLRPGQQMATLIVIVSVVSAVFALYRIHSRFRDA